MGGGIITFFLKSTENIRYKIEYETYNTPQVFVQEHQSNRKHACTASKGQVTFKHWQNRKWLQQQLVRVRNTAEVCLALCQSLQRLRSPGWEMLFQENSGLWQWCQIWCHPLPLSLTSCPVSCSFTNLGSVQLSIQLSFSTDPFLSFLPKKRLGPVWVTHYWGTYTTSLFSAARICFNECLFLEKRKNKSHLYPAQSTEILVFRHKLVARWFLDVIFSFVYH